MLGKIIVGVIIGFVSGLLLSKNNDENDLSLLIFIAIVLIGFIGSSLIYGIVYGLMAIGEIAIGFIIAFSIFVKESQKTYQKKEINNKPLNKFHYDNYTSNIDINKLLREFEDNKTDIKTQIVLKNNLQPNEKDKILNEYDIKYIYHMTHIDNLENILKYGLLSHHNNAVNHNIDNPEVNDRRNFYEPIYNKNVHDYVPFYFNPRNAMLYVNRDKQDEIIILAFDRNLIYKKGSLFTDGNASVQGTRFYKDIKDLNKLNWQCLKSKYWNDFEDGKRLMMAEVLVPDNVNIKYLKKIYCKNIFTQSRVDDLVQYYPNIKVEINNKMYF